VSRRSDLYRRLPVVDADRWWLEQAVAAPVPRVLELGAGTGRLTRAFAAHGCEVVAVERDPDMLAALRQTAGEAARIVAADVAELPRVGASGDELGRDHGLVALPTSLLNELTDAEARRRLLRSAAERCHPQGRVAMQLLGPWWLASLPPRSVGRLLPADGSRAIDVTIEAADLEPWEGRRRARLTYRFPDGAALTDDLEADIVTPTELTALLAEVGLELIGRFGAVPPAPPAAHDPAWHLVARPVTD
jgi:SAM-dependent methyltransferase